MYFIDIIHLDPIVRETMRLVFSSTRPMPAHYTSNGERTQSFCIDFAALTPEDDYAMASVSWYSSSEFITDKTRISQEQNGFMVRVGEDVMVGAYIVTKLGRPDLVEAVYGAIIDDTREWFQDKIEMLNMITTDDEVRTYLKYCLDFGKAQALGEEEVVA